MNYGDESGAMSPGTGPPQHGSSTYLEQLNLCYGDGLEENDGHYRCLGMGSINDGDDRPQRLPPGNY